MKRRIAFFDFDGTITTKDTLLEFIKFSKGSLSFYRGFLLYSPYLIAYKIRLISNQLAKEKILRHFFGNIPLEEFTQTCNAFADNALPALIRPRALQQIRNHQSAGILVVIVSASPENWLSCWTRKMGLALIGTRLEVKNNYLTGNIIGKNCHGEEKVSRIRNEYELNQYTDIYAYGDSRGDKPMLALATKPFYKPFRS